MTQFLTIASFVVSAAASLSEAHGRAWVPPAALLDEGTLMQSHAALRQDLLPEAAAGKSLLVEVTTFTCSTLIMTICLLAFVQWATGVAALDKAPHYPDASSAEATWARTYSFTQFLEAVDAGDVGVPAVLLEANPSFVLDKNASGATALHVAAMAGASDIIKELLERGASLDARDDHNETPLHSAAATGELCCLIALVDAGADLEVENTNGATPLVVAAKADQLAACELLLDHGASPCVGSAAPPANLEELLAERFLIYEVEDDVPLPLKEASQTTVSTSEGDSMASGSPTLSAFSPTISGLSPRDSERFFMFGDEGTDSK